MGFWSRKPHITFTEKAVVWTFTLDDSAIQGALKCGSENLLARERLSELSGTKHHTLMSSIGGNAQENKTE
jgi:hypothetical protein